MEYFDATAFNISRFELMLKVWNLSLSWILLPQIWNSCHIDIERSQSNMIIFQPIQYLIGTLITWSRAPSHCPRTCRWCRRARSTWRRWVRTRSGNVPCARRCRGQPAPQTSYSNPHINTMTMLPLDPSMSAGPYWWCRPRGLRGWSPVCRGSSVQTSQTAGLQWGR